MKGFGGHRGVLRQDGGIRCYVVCNSQWEIWRGPHKRQTPLCFPHCWHHNCHTVLGVIIFKVQITYQDTWGSFKCRFLGLTCCVLTLNLWVDAPESASATNSPGTIMQTEACASLTEWPINITLKKPRVFGEAHGLQAMPRLWEKGNVRQACYLQGSLTVPEVTGPATRGKTHI